jgi:hypothetical protein
MKHLSQQANKSIDKLSAMLQERLGERVKSTNQIQVDPETHSSLCEIEFLSEKALVWVRPNGSVSSVDGVRILLSGGFAPKTNPSISAFTQKI